MRKTPLVLLSLLASCSVSMEQPPAPYVNKGTQSYSKSSGAADSNLAVHDMDFKEVENPNIERKDLGESDYSANTSTESSKPIPSYKTSSRNGSTSEFIDGDEDTSERIIRMPEKPSDEKWQSPQIAANDIKQTPKMVEVKEVVEEKPKASALDKIHPKEKPEYKEEKIEAASGKIEKSTADLMEEEPQAKTAVEEIAQNSGENDLKEDGDDVIKLPTKEESKVEPKVEPKLEAKKVEEPKAEAEAKKETAKEEKIEMPKLAAKETPSKEAPSKEAPSKEEVQKLEAEELKAEAAKNEAAKAEAKKEAAKEEKIEVAKTTKEEPVKNKAVKFIKPLDGVIIRKFGEKDGSSANDGINIQAAEGTPVKAAEGGTVVYSGNQLQGYGNLVIIRHSSGFLTAYAHMKDLELKKGDSVGQGDIVGHVGKTGNVSEPQLHFGVRKGREAMNPADFL